ncbi:hypothetical protein CHARACLAT_024043 [Characodon lateralis]|uniref:Uncharacterized protein n=1 Tax=Characodon lateralis TaxID=208331 RepID=A0ABU7DJC5_9TELE|nr:hypothetical protein [Characodon lateralis]
MPPFTTEDFDNLLQKLATLEMKIHRLEVNVEVNMGYSDDSTLPVIPNNDSQLNYSAGKQNTECSWYPWKVLLLPADPPGMFEVQAQKIKVDDSLEDLSN